VWRHQALTGWLKIQLVLELRGHAERSVLLLPSLWCIVLQAALQRLGLDGDAWVRVQAAALQTGQQGDGTSTGAAVCEAPVRALLQGVLDLSGASPRRYLFQVLAHHATNELQRERLQYFATAEGRDDLYRCAWCVLPGHQAGSGCLNALQSCTRVTAGSGTHVAGPEIHSLVLCGAPAVLALAAGPPRYNQKERRSLLEVLQDFSSAQPPLERLLEAAPILQARQFSLASAPAAHGSRAAILAAVVHWKTVTNRPRKGLLTNWLAGLQPPAGGAAGSSDAVRVPVWIDRGAFRLPPNPDTPLLLVGPGTGVAPFRSFINHRAAVNRQQQQQPAQAAAQPAPSSSCLFFGCRSPTADFYYASEWWPLMQAQALHPAHGLVVAFSRHQPQPSQQQLVQLLQEAAAAWGTQQQQPGPQQPAGSTANGGVQPAAAAGEPAPAAPTFSSSRVVHVTHKLRECGAVVWQLLSQAGAWVYVSGSAEKMPAGVAAALEDVASQHGGLSKEDASKFVRQLELTGRYHVEAWS
jgi:sulfite reductase alpha subunit-like flavoprotein